jgi:TatD DNase family protein
VSTRWYDAHVHLHDRRLADREGEWLAGLDLDRVGAAMTNGLEPDDWTAAARLRVRLPWVRVSYGLHPWFISRRPPDWNERLSAALEEDPTAGVGEIGLDGWILTDSGARRLAREGLDPIAAPLAEQRAIFRAQLDTARRHGRACSIHCLRAWPELLAELRQSPPAPRGFLVHAFAGPREVLHALLDLGACVSFNAAFVGARDAEQRRVFRDVPPDRLLVETDAPDMIPPPGPGVRLLPARPGEATLNHPGNLSLAYAGLAETLGWPRARLEEQVEENFLRLFAPSAPPSAPVRPPSP